MRHIRFDGHRLAYRVAGDGPALVVLHLYRRRDVIQLRQLQDVDFIEYAGVGHEVGGDDDLQADVVIPDVIAWTARRLGPSW